MLQRLQGDPAYGFLIQVVKLHGLAGGKMHKIDSVRFNASGHKCQLVLLQTAAWKASLSMLALPPLCA